MINLDNGVLLIAVTFIFASALAGRVSNILEKYGFNIKKTTQSATLWFIFSCLLLLTGYFYVVYLLLFRWRS